MSMKKIALTAGTFDPVTTGHIDIIRRATEIFDEVIVAVYTNPAKNTLLTEETRLKAVSAAVADMPNVRAVKGEGLIADFAKKCGACAIVKGVRGISDFSYEEEMALANRAVSGIETLLLFSSAECMHISSTLVRELYRCGRDYSAYIPAAAYEIVSENLK